MDNMKHRRLQELDRSDFEIVKGEPDIRGWDIKNARGQKIGEVEELIIDAQQKKVRYMVVDLDDNELKLDHRKILLPIGFAELHQKDDDVILPNVNAEHLNALPGYDKNNIQPNIERKICEVLGRKTETSSVLEGEEIQSDFYRHDYFNDDNLYKNRLHETHKEAKHKEPSDYERGLRLWELRSEGGVLPEGREQNKRSEINEEARMEMVHNRRREYENNRRRYHDSDHRHNDNHRRDNSITGRLRDEGLQDG